MLQARRLCLSLLLLAIVRLHLHFGRSLHTIPHNVVSSVFEWSLPAVHHGQREQSSGKGHWDSITAGERGYATIEWSRLTLSRKPVNTDGRQPSLCRLRVNYYNCHVKNFHESTASCSCEKGFQKMPYEWHRSDSLTHKFSPTQISPRVDLPAICLRIHSPTRQYQRLITQCTYVAWSRDSGTQPQAGGPASCRTCVTRRKEKTNPCVPIHIPARCTFRLVHCVVQNAPCRHH